MPASNKRPALRGDMVPWQRRMLDALLSTKGDRVAAAEILGVKRDSLTGSLFSLRARDDLTEAERVVVARQRRSRRPEAS